MITPSKQCKSAGIQSLAELARISSERGASAADIRSRVRTLINWHKNKPELFAVVVAGAVSIKQKENGK